MPPACVRSSTTCSATSVPTRRRARRARITVDGEDDGAVITVADDGPGMEPEEAEHIFERFYRSDPSRSRAHGGAGLGLSIVSAIVAAHGGTVSAEGRVGEGYHVHRAPPSGPPPEPDRRAGGATATARCPGRGGCRPERPPGTATWRQTPASGTHVGATSPGRDAPMRLHSRLPSSARTRTRSQWLP